MVLENFVCCLSSWSADEILSNGIQFWLHSDHSLHGDQIELEDLSVVSETILFSSSVWLFIMSVK